METLKDTCRAIESFKGYTARERRAQASASAQIEANLAAWLRANGFASEEAATAAMFAACEVA